MNAWREMKTAPKDGTVILLELEETLEVVAACFTYDQFTEVDCWVIFTPDVACLAMGLDPIVDRMPIRWRNLV